MSSVLVHSNEIPLQVFIHSFVLNRTSLFDSLIASKVRHSAVVAPITGLAPSEWVVLWSSHFSSLGIDIALELGLCASSHIRVQLFSVSICSNSGAFFQLREHISCSFRARRLNNVAVLVGHRVLVCWRGVGSGSARSWSAESAGRLFLKPLEDLLLLLGEAWWRGLGCPCCSVRLGGREWAAEEAWAHGADGSGDRVHGIDFELVSW